MKIVSLKALNINSLKGKTEIDFEVLTRESALFAITGTTGSGKSTILDIISCALYGRTVRLKNPSDLISRHAGEAYCEVVFEVNRKHYRCSWSQRKSRGKVDGKLQKAKMELVDLATNTIFPLKPKEVAKKVEEISGLDFERFTQSMLLAQGAFDAFLRADANERSTLLEKITGTQKYAEISKMIYAKHGDFVQDIQAQQKVLASIDLLDKEELEAKLQDLSKVEQAKEATQKELQNIKNVLHVEKSKEEKEQDYVIVLAKCQTIQDEQVQVNKEYIQIQETFTAVEKTYNDAMKQLKKAYALQIQLRDVSKTRKATQKTLHTKEVLVKELKHSVEKLQQEYEEIMQEVAKSEHYLTTHQEDEELLTRWALLSDTLKRYKEHQVISKKAHKTLGVVQEHFTKITTEQDQIKDILNKVQEAFRAKEQLYQSFSEDKQIILEEWKDKLYEIERLSDVYKRYKSFIEKKQNILKEEKEYNVRLKIFTQNIQTLQDYIVTLKKHIKVLREKKARENLLRKYEEDRKHLQDGEACFLCGATEHPFLEAMPTYELHDGEIEQQEQLLDKKEEEYKTLLSSLSAIQTEKNRLDKDKIAIEEELCLFTNCIDINEQLLTQEHKDVQKKVAILQDYQKERDRLQREKEDLQQKLYFENNKVHTIQITVEKEYAEVKRLQDVVVQEQEENVSLLKQLALYGVDVANIDVSVSELLKKKQAYEEAMRALKTLQEDKNQCFGLKKEREMEYTLLQKDILDVNNVLVTLQEREKALHVEQVNVLNVSDLGRYEEEKIEEYRTAQKGLQELEKKKIVLEKQNQEKALYLKQLVEKIETDAKELEKIYALLGYRYIYNELENLEALLEQKNGSLQELVGSIKKELEIYNHNNEKFQDEVRAIKSKEKELAIWTKLNELIGSAKGDKFKKFAQGITLDQLIYLANKHLKILSTRYTLTRNTQEILELEIVDGYQGDVVRPIATLSGGESFIVSLALALGLSELASQRTSIDSLFLDEGFGTLDAQSLEMALNALNLLQTEGKMVGVISHVEALKERIPLQIRVIPRGDGTSYVEVNEG